jgi:hypothetical protein
MIAGRWTAFAPLRPKLAIPIIPLMHIRSDQSAFVECRRLQRYASATVLYFLSTDSLAELSDGYGRAAAPLCVATCRLGQRSNAGTIPAGKSRKTLINRLFYYNNN